MTTSFDEIYRKFLKMVDDYELDLVSPEELNEILFDYLDTARSLYFPQCKKDLDNIVESIGIGNFTVTLTSQEQHILALGMKKAWISPKKLSVDLMRKDIGDRDYKAVQGFNYLKELEMIDIRIENEIRRYAVEYTYKDFSLEGW